MGCLRRAGRAARVYHRCRFSFHAPACPIHYAQKLQSPYHRREKRRKCALPSLLPRCPCRGVRWTPSAPPALLGRHGGSARPNCEEGTHFPVNTCPPQASLKADTIQERWRLFLPTSNMARAMRLRFCTPVRHRNTVRQCAYHAYAISPFQKCVRRIGPVGAAKIRCATCCVCTGSGTRLCVCHAMSRISHYGNLHGAMRVLHSWTSGLRWMARANTAHRRRTCR